MPQLMPLNWMFSSIMLMLVVAVISMLYSELSDNSNIMMILTVKNKIKNEWYW